MKATWNTRVMVGVGSLLLVLMLWHLIRLGFHREFEQPQWVVVGGDPVRGKGLLVSHGCASCHVIPGIRAPQGRVGPQLHDLRRQMYIAGQIPNTPEDLVRWIQDPEALIPGTAMPSIGLTEQEARDMAAYIYGDR